MARPKTVSTPKVVAEVTIDPANITAGATLDVTATVKGLVKWHPVIVQAPSLESGLALSNAHCSAANTVKFRLSNYTGGAINPASQAFQVVQF